MFVFQWTSIYAVYSFDQRVNIASGAVSFLCFLPSGERQPYILQRSLTLAILCFFFFKTSTIF
jgi:hypothetical protein